MPDLFLADEKLQIDPSRLCIGLANGWAGTNGTTSKSLLLWPEDLAQAWANLNRKGLQPRGFGYWQIGLEGLTPQPESAQHPGPLNLAKRLNEFVQTRS